MTDYAKWRGDYFLLVTFIAWDGSIGCPFFFTKFFLDEAIASCQLPQPNLLYTTAYNYTHNCAATAPHTRHNFERFLLHKYPTGHKAIISPSCKTNTSLSEEYL